MLLVLVFVVVAVVVFPRLSMDVVFGDGVVVLLAGWGGDETI